MKLKNSLGTRSVILHDIYKKLDNSLNLLYGLILKIIIYLLKKLI